MEQDFENKNIRKFDILTTALVVFTFMHLMIDSMFYNIPILKGLVADFFISHGKYLDLQTLSTIGLPFSAVSYLLSLVAILKIRKNADMRSRSDKYIMIACIAVNAVLLILTIIEFYGLTHAHWG